MEHQDWNTLYVNLKDKSKATNVENKSDKNKVKKDNNFVLQKDSKLEQRIGEGDMKHQKISKELSKQIQQGRLSKGLTQKQLANQLSIPVNEINQMENGQYLNNKQKISKVKRFLSIK